MPVDSPSGIYNYYKPIWAKSRVAVAGQESVKSVDEYLPCPAGYDASWYSGLKRRAYWFDASGTTTKTYQGAIYRKNPVLTPSFEDSSEDMQELLNSVDPQYNDLVTFSTIVTNDVLKTSYAGILVDFDNTDGQRLTQDRAKDLEKRARMIFYPAESIFHANSKHIRLWETYSESTDEFYSEVKKQIKVLDILEVAENGRKVKKYRQRIYRELETDGEKTEYAQFGPDFFPTLPSGESFDFIPFQFIGAKNNDSQPDQPIIEGLVNANFQHYGLYSDMREAIHWIRPFIYETGYQPPTDGQETARVVNPNIMMTSNNPDAKFGILEFNGSGLQWDFKTLEMLEWQMASMGADMLKTQKKASESADKARIDKSSESSVLATLVNNISAAITKSLNIMMKWNGQESDYKFQLNTDYDVTMFDAQLMTAINSSVEQRTISQKTAIENFKKGELIQGSVEDEIEQIALETGGVENMDMLIEQVTNIVRAEISNSKPEMEDET